VGTETLAIIRKFVQTGEALHCVNSDAKTVAEARKKLDAHADELVVNLGKLNPVKGMAEWLEALEATYSSPH
jgi:hypothetical protein